MFTTVSFDGSSQGSLYSLLGFFILSGRWLFKRLFALPPSSGQFIYDYKIGVILSV